MDIAQLREQIDAIDDKMLELYLERMAICKEIAEYKAKNDIGVTDGNRENQILYRLAKKSAVDLQVYVKELYGAIFATSKAYQNTVLDRYSDTLNEIDSVLGKGQKSLPVSASVACQGIMGSNSERAVKKIFPISDISFFKDFDSVFNAVDKGFSEFGVLPIENSTAGSVLEVYDLMKKYDFRIVQAVRLRVDHCLAVYKTADIKNITVVSSHPQALSQCKEYISTLKLKAEKSENTAVAARDLSISKDQTKAVICSEACATEYGLKIVARNIQDNSENYTRFICISKKFDIFKGSDKVSVVTSLPHESGSLSKILSSFSAHGLNLTKIESRPMSSDFEFLFYFDFEGDITSKSVQNLLSQLERSSDKFKLLGCYKELV